MSQEDKNIAIGRLVNFVCAYDGENANDYEYTILNVMAEYKKLLKLREGVEKWVNVTMKNYTDQQYGKGDIKKLLGE